MIDREAFHLLGRHVADRPHDRPGLRVARARRGARLLAGGNGLDPLGQAEVEDLDVAVSADEEVLGLQVPVDDALLVGRGKALCDLQRVVHGLLLGDRTCVELPAQRLAFQKLHDGVGDAVLVAEVVDGKDVRMRQRRDGLRFALEPRERVGIRGDGLGQDLDRDVPIELLVPRPVDLSHPTRAERRRGSRRARERELPGKAQIDLELTILRRPEFYFRPATSFWNRGFLRSASKSGSIVSQPGERMYGILSSGSS